MFFLRAIHFNHSILMCFENFGDLCYQADANPGSDQSESVQAGAEIQVAVAQSESEVG
jgi:hypothetical protein